VSGPGANNTGEWIGPVETSLFANPVVDFP
jgi:hypothetical protein